MPKKAKIHPNERVDASDFKYVSETLIESNTNNLNHRLWTGEYRGGTVLEGFHVEITNAATREIVVHNGIALDREGRLIVFESGDNFADNTDLSQQINLTAANVNHYVFVELRLADSDKDSRAFWDPTFDNGLITDSAGNTHPAEPGREAAVTVPTRIATSWRVLENITGFEDAGDPGTRVRTLRIPVAIIPVAGGAITTGAMGLNGPRTTVLERANTNSTILVCENTRHFPSAGTLTVTDQDGYIVLSTETYTQNDRENNTLFGISTPNSLAIVRIGDIVSNTTAAVNFVATGSQWDARPMFFAATDTVSASTETVFTSAETRNACYYSGRALIIRPDGVLATVNEVYDNRAITAVNLRSEHHIKVLQDYVRAMGTIVREMKYDQPLILAGIATVGAVPVNTELEDTTEFFDVTMVGGTIEITAGTGASGPFTITGVDGEHRISIAPSTFALAPDGTSIYVIHARNPSDSTKYVDSREVGNLHEVYLSRIDKLANTYKNNLQSRLRANKVPIVTVGDGFNTIGDYNGSAGLTAAIARVSTLGIGGIIFVKRGTYTITGVHSLGSNTTLIGEGPLATQISLANINSLFYLTGFTGDTFGYNIQIKDLSIIAPVDGTAGITGRGAVFTNTLLGVSIPIHNLVFDNVRLYGGSITTATELVHNWLIYLGADAAEITATKEVSFNNCKLHVCGGGICFTNARDIKITKCTFQSEDENVPFTAMVEGIRLEDNNTDATAVYGATASKVPGEVIISDCIFKGQHTNPIAAVLRGWVFVAPNYSGQSINISNCQFTGDLFGSAVAVLPDAPRVGGLTQQGGALLCAGYVNVTITSCNFHTYELGINHVAGFLLVSGNSFWGCKEALRVGRNIDYTTIEAYFVGINQTTRTTFVGNIVEGDNIIFSYGVYVVENSIASVPAELYIKDNTFDSLYVGISTAPLSAALGLVGGAIPTVYNNIVVSGNSFNNLTHSAFRSSVNGSANAPSVAAANADWGVDTFVYTNNTHNSTTLVAENYVEFSAYKVTISNNMFSTIVASVNTGTIVAIPGSATQLKVLNNQFYNCVPIINPSTLVLISVDVGCTLADYTISNNQASNSTSAVVLVVNGAVQNGIKFIHYRSVVATSMFVNLVCSNNSMSLVNTNFMLLAQQDTSAAEDEVWEWNEVVVEGNKFQLLINSTLNFAAGQYSNNATYNAQAFLSGTQPLGAANGYVGGVDLRRFRSNVSGVYRPSCTIGDNVVTVINPPYSSTLNRDENCNIGIRISKFPPTVNVSNNNLIGCSLLLKWNYQTPVDDITYPTGGYRINIGNNNVETLAEGCAVDINSAVGYDTSNVAGDIDNLYAKYTHLNFSGNMVTGHNDSTLGAYGAFYNVVRIWAYDEYPAVGPATVDLKFFWNIGNNTLINSVLYIDDAAAGADLAALAAAAAPANFHSGMAVIGTLRASINGSTNAGNIAGLTGDVGSGTFAAANNTCVAANIVNNTRLVAASGDVRGVAAGWDVL